MAAQSRPPTVDLLLNLVPDAPESVLSALRAHPSLASAQDSNGYSLLHAATSYGHTDLMRALVKDFGVSPEIVDDDGDTPLFAAEKVDTARVLVEDLGCDVNHKNHEGFTAKEKIESEGDWPLVSAYLLNVTSQSTTVDGTGSGSADALNGDSAQATDDGSVAARPPPLPPNVQINFGAMEEPAGGDAPDEEFRRRIEELASRTDFHGEAGQKELEELVREAVSGLSERDASSTRRRRME